jgi:hypothetical protein
LTEQKRQDEINARARKHRRELDKTLDRVGKADRMVLAARLGQPGDAKRRLRWAAYTYRDAAIRLGELLPIVEVDDLRLTLQNVLEDTNARIVRTFLKLGDLRFVTGDVTGALEAAHEVLSLDPANKEAAGLRDRILDAGSRSADTAPITTTYPGFLYRRHCYPGYVGYARGFGVFPVTTSIRFGRSGLRISHTGRYPFPCR